jgi:hypothetical protein
MESRDDDILGHRFEFKDGHVDAQRVVVVVAKPGTTTKLPPRPERGATNARTAEAITIPPNTTFIILFLLALETEYAGPSVGQTRLPTDRL